MHIRERISTGTKESRLEQTSKRTREERVIKWIPSTEKTREQTSLAPKTTKRATITKERISVTPASLHFQTNTIQHLKKIVKRHSISKKKTEF
jgi:hypothetical protein